MKFSIFHFALLLLILSACKKDKVPQCADTWETDPAGSWYSGDLHVHATGASNDTGGDSYPSDIKKQSQNLGLDFVVLTDHSNSTGSDPDTTYEDPSLFNQGPEFTHWDSTQILTDPLNFLMVTGNEISPRSPDNNTATGHIGCIPIDINTFDKDYVFTDRPMGTVNGANTLQQATAAGCFKVVNHPYSINRWISFDWSSFDYNAIEVWNGTIGYDNFDSYGYDAWICDLLAGRKVTPVGGSDAHRVYTPEPGQGLDPALGYPTTLVFAESLEWDNIMNGLLEGNVAIVEGESRLFIDDYTEGKCRANQVDVGFIRLRGAVDMDLENPTLTLYHFTDCNDPRPATDAYPVPTENVLYDVELSPGESFDFGIEVSGAKGVYTAILSGDNYHYWALSKAIVIK